MTTLQPTQHPAIQRYRNWLVELTASETYLARHPITGSILVEESGMTGRFDTVDQACDAIDRKMAAPIGLPTWCLAPRAVRASLYS